MPSHGKIPSMLRYGFFEIPRVVQLVPDARYGDLRPPSRWVAARSAWSWSRWQHATMPCKVLELIIKALRQMPA